MAVAGRSTTPRIDTAIDRRFDNGAVETAGAVTFTTGISDDGAT